MERGRSGKTKYACASLFYPTTSSGELVSVSLGESKWSKKFAEDEGKNFKCPTGKVMTGRGHEGDSSGLSKIRCSELDIDSSVRWVEVETSEKIVESSGEEFVCPAGKALVGRMHTGGEDGWTTYTCAGFEFQGTDTCLPREDATQRMNQAFASFTPVLNRRWPEYVEEEELDPWKDVWAGKIDIGCKSGGDEVCGFHSKPLAGMIYTCKSFFVKLNVKSLSGLAALEFRDLGVESLDSSSSEPPCKKSSLFQPNCGYSGKGDGSADLRDSGQLKAKLRDVLLKAKCKLDGLVNQDFVVYQGKADCVGKQPDGKAEFSWCSAACSFVPEPVLQSLELDTLKLHLKTLDCDFTGDWGFKFKDPIADEIIEKSKDGLVDALSPIVKKEINSMVAGLLPFPSPSSCEVPEEEESTSSDS